MTRRFSKLWMTEDRWAVGLGPGIASAGACRADFLSTVVLARFWADTIVDDVKEESSLSGCRCRSPSESLPMDSGHQAYKV